MTFTEKCEQKIGGLIQQFAKAPELVGFITNGVPVAIATYLRRQLMELAMSEDIKTMKDLEAELSIGGLMTFSLKASKRGDSIAITPAFEMLEKGIAAISKDKLEYSDEDHEILGVELANNELFASDLRGAFAGYKYDDDADEWKADKKSDKKANGLWFDDEADVAVVTCCTLTAILEILTNNKDAASEIEYLVPGLAKFTVKYVSNKWTVSVSFDKAYKTNCKSDKLVEQITKLGL